MEQTRRLPPVTAAQVARKRLEDYFDEKLAGHSDRAMWDFYTRLWLEAEKIPVDTSGFLSYAYQEDRERARENREAYKISREVGKTAR
jgi:hypothetical protein